MGKVEIDEKAKKFIKDKDGDSVTIKLERFGGGWAGCTYMPAVYVGAPQDISEYDACEVDGIKVYISPFVSRENGLRVTTSGFAFFKGLAVIPIS